MGSTRPVRGYLSLPACSYSSASSSSLFHLIPGIVTTPVSIYKPSRPFPIARHSHIKDLHQPPHLCSSVPTIVCFGRFLIILSWSPISVSVWSLERRLICCICYRLIGSDFAVSISARPISHHHLLYLLSKSVSLLSPFLWMSSLVSFAA